MTEKEKEELIIEMKSKRDELKILIAQMKEDTKPMGLDDAVGRLSRMDYINNKSVNESGLRKSEADVRGIERWLSLADSPDFARCNRCGIEINPKRLLFLPASALCVI